MLSESELPDVAPQKKVDVKTTVDAEEVRLEQSVWQSERKKRLDDALEQLPRTILPSRHEYHPTEEAPRSLVADIDTDTAAVGRALHSYMALIRTVTTLDDKLADYVTNQEGIQRETIERLVKNCLESELWREASEGRRLWREIPFCVNVPGGMMRGAIDLMWEDSEGNIHIADWKTGQFDPDRHRQQLREYMQSVEQTTGRKVKSANLFFAATGKRTSMQT